MPEFNTEYQKITPSVKELPTSTALILQPMTLEAVGSELESDRAVPQRVDNIDAAFQVFRPAIHFKSEGPNEIVVDLEFTKMAHFDPKNIVKPSPNRRNDLAKLQSTIELLYRIKERWAKPAVRTAWRDKNQRQEIINSLSSLRAELQAIAGQREE